MAKRCFVWLSAVVLLFPLIGGLFSRALAGTPGGAEGFMRRAAVVRLYSPHLPASKRGKRTAANDKRSSFVGSDFSYEDVSGRAVEEDNHTLLREDKYGGIEDRVIKK